MALVQPSAVKDQALARIGREVSPAEQAIREAVEAWGRLRWPKARVVHELVVGRGKNRVDIAFIDTDHWVVIELKSAADYCGGRLLDQIGMFRLSAPEIWLAVDPRHADDAKLSGKLLPSMGLMICDAYPNRGAVGAWLNDKKMVPLKERTIEIVAQPKPFAQDPACMLNVLWRDELFCAVRDCHGSAPAPRITHPQLVKLMLREPAEIQMAAVCRQLRARDALWVADPPIAEEKS